MVGIGGCDSAYTVNMYLCISEELVQNICLCHSSDFSLTYFVDEIKNWLRLVNAQKWVHCRGLFQKWGHQLTPCVASLFPNHLDCQPRASGGFSG